MNCKKLMFIVLAGLFFSAHTVDISVKFADGTKKIDKDLLEQIPAYSKALGEMDQINFPNVTESTFNIFATKIFPTIQKENAQQFEKTILSLSTAQQLELHQLFEQLKISDEFFQNMYEKFLNTLQSQLLDQSMETFQKNPERIKSITKTLNPALDNILSLGIFEDPAWKEWFWLSKKINPRTMKKDIKRASAQAINYIFSTQASESEPTTLLAVNALFKEDKNPHPLFIANYPEEKMIKITFAPVPPITSFKTYTINDLEARALAVSPHGQSLAYVTHDNELGILLLEHVDTLIPHQEVSFFAIGNSKYNKVVGTLPKFQYTLDKRSWITYDDDPTIDSIAWVNSKQAFLSLHGSLIGLYDFEQKNFIGSLISIPKNFDIADSENAPHLLLDFHHDKKTDTYKLALAQRDTINHVRYASVLTIQSIGKDWTKGLVNPKQVSHFSSDSFTIYPLTETIKGAVFSKKNPIVQKISLPGSLNVLSDARRYIETIKINPNGTEVAIGWANGTIELHPFDTNAKVKTYRDLSEAITLEMRRRFKKFVEEKKLKSQLHLSFSPSGSFLIATNPLKGNAKIIETALFSNAESFSIPNPTDENYTNVVWSPDNDYIFLTTAAGAYYWRTVNESFDNLPVHEEGYTAFQLIKQQMTIDGALALKYMYKNNIKRRKDLPDKMLPLFDQLPDLVKAFFVINREDYKNIKEISQYAAHITKARQTLNEITRQPIFGEKSIQPELSRSEEIDFSKLDLPDFPQELAEEDQPQLPAPIPQEPEGGEPEIPLKPRAKLKIAKKEHAVPAEQFETGKRLPGEMTESELDEELKKFEEEFEQRKTD